MIFIPIDKYSVPHQLQPVLQITMSSYKSSDSRTGSRVPEGHRIFPDGSIAPANSTFCKVCYDAGCSVADYTNHFVKSQPGPDGVVVCPTLMSQKCRICHIPGHTSTYCPRYIPRDQRRSRDEERRPREEERRPREEERRPRDDERRPRYDDRRDISFNRLREDTERHEREIRDRDDHYYRQQDRNSKQYLQAALKPASASSSRQNGYDDNRNHHHNLHHHQQRSGPTAPYAHPHNLRVRLQLEQQAMSAYASHNKIDLPAVPAAVPAATAIDMRQVELGHAPKWSDEDAGAEMLFQQFAAFVNVRETGDDEFMSREEDEFMMMCDNQSGKCFPDSPRF
jgi:hypothetical protein